MRKMPVLGGRFRGGRGAAWSSLLALALAQTAVAQAPTPPAPAESAPTAAAPGDAASAPRVPAANYPPSSLVNSPSVRLSIPLEAPRLSQSAKMVLRGTMISA